MKLIVTYIVQNSEKSSNLLFDFFLLLEPLLPPHLLWPISSKPLPAIYKTSSYLQKGSLYLIDNQIYVRGQTRRKGAFHFSVFSALCFLLILGEISCFLGPSVIYFELCFKGKFFTFLIPLLFPFPSDCFDIDFIYLDLCTRMCFEIYVES